MLPIRNEMNAPIGNAAGLDVTDDVAVCWAVGRPFQRDQNAELPRCVFTQTQQTELFVGGGGRGRRRQRRQGRCDAAADCRRRRVVARWSRRLADFEARRGVERPGPRADGVGRRRRCDWSADAVRQPRIRASCPVLPAGGAAACVRSVQRIGI